MPEIKSNFAGGKMNKDVDERLVPNGEYRNALNVQISTSEGSDVGTVQSVLGNSLINTLNLPTNGVCISSIADEKNDAFYYLLAQPYTSFSSSNPQPTVRKNLILQHKNAIVNTVFCDIISTQQTIYQAGGNIVWDDTVQTITFPNSTFVEALSVGMFMQITASFLQQSVLALIDNPIISISGNTIALQNDISWLTTNVTGQSQYHQTILTFGPSAAANTTNNGVLGFNINNPITGINIIDDLLFWTDGITEPKKINITNSLDGTANGSLSHTKLLNSKTGLTLAENKFVEEKHITVIKKPPKSVLRIESESNFDVPYGTTPADTHFNLPAPATGLVYPEAITEVYLLVDPLSPLGFPPNGSTILFNPVSDPDLPNDEHQVKATLSSVFADGSYDFVDSNGNVLYAAGTWQGWSIEIQSIDGLTSLTPQAYNWAKKEPEIKLFKNKFPRYSYRYKYIDGEYSSFGPFTNVIFEPGNFKYDVKEAYNLGMENDISKTTLFDYNLNVPKDVVEIDLLYKESNSPLVYTIDTIHGDKWLTNNATSADGYEIRPDQLRATLPENQLLRSWDNVPRSSLAQEITGSRMVYGNYLQNYNVQSDDTYIYAWLKNRLNCDHAEASKEGKKSLKSLRNYTLGISYLDKYGRQTPVFTNKEAEVDVAIEDAKDSNQFDVRIGGTIPGWATHYKIFIKETSDEYYNLAMDRIYDARDGNIWISFPSSDRNKVDEETFLILKKGVEGAAPVVEKNRYKILAIENEAPEFIKTKQRLIGTVREGGSGNFPGTYFTNLNGYTVVDNKTIIIDKGEWDTVGLSLENFDSFVLKFSILVGTNDLVQNSREYEVVNFEADTEYKFVLKDPIHEDDDFLQATGISEPAATIGITIYNTKVENSPQFDGRFFVKVSRDMIINDYIISQASQSLIVQQSMVQALPFYYLSDSDSWNGVDTSSAVPGISGGSTSTQSEWQAFFDQTGSEKSCWFIDQAYYDGYFPPADAQYLNNYGMSAKGSNSTAYNTTTTMNASTTGHNKGIWTDTNGQTWMYLTFGYPKFDNATTWTTDSSQLQQPNPTAQQIAEANSCAHWYPHVWATCPYSACPCTTTNWRAWNGIVEDGYWNSDGSAFVSVDDSIKYWKIGDAAMNPAHGDENARVSYFYQGSKFRFAGDPDNTIYEIDAVPDKYYHFNHWNYDNMENLFAASTGWTPTTDEWLTTEHYIKMVAKMANAHNRRITYRIPISSVTPGSPNNPTDSNSSFNPIAAGHADASNLGTIQFLEEEWLSIDDQVVPEDPAIWETEPKKDAGLDVYYEAGNAFPLEINDETNYSFAPVGSTVVGGGGLLGADITAEVVSWNTNNLGFLNLELSEAIYYPNGLITFHRPDGSCVTAVVNGMEPFLTQLPNNTWGSNVLRIDRDVSQRAIKLSWFNCYSWGNGVESNRIRDDYNQTTIDKGAKASSTVDEPYEEEYRKYGLIYSGLYNSTSGVNNLNQFITAEKITKDINPIYGSIQKLHSRDSDLITLCEDKVLKILANKDAVFNADGNPQLTATSNVLGQTVPFSGEYGISTNPESFASESYRVYFTDKVRGAVMRLSKDGLTPISMHGMKDWFRDNLKLSNKLIGSYDDREEEYNITLDNTVDNIPKTVSFREDVKGWVSFRSFTPENAISCANEYYSFVQGALWKHYSNEERNNFYNIPNNSTIDVMLNDVPGSVKSFNTLNYEGSDSKIDTNLLDNDYYNLSSRPGWHVNSIVTDLEKGSLNEFIEKEGKWFNYIKGNNVQVVNDGTSHILMNADGSSSFDQASFAIQGIGILGNNPIVISTSGCTNPNAANYDPAATTDDGSCIAFVYGCLELSALNYYPGASADDGGCIWMGCFCDPVTYPNGCLNTGSFPEAYAYNGGTSIIDDGTCIAIVPGCTDPLALNYNPLANSDDGSCIPIVNGCMVMNASNYNFLANVDNGTCTWYGCTNPLDSYYGVTQPSGPPIPWPIAAFGYVPSGGQYGMQDDGSCIDGGCTDTTASNFNASALWDNGSCVYCNTWNINVDAIVLNTTGQGQNNGSIEVEPVVGADDTPYTYGLTNSSGSTAFTASSSGNATIFAPLPPDTYTLVINSASGCVATEIYTVIDSVVIYPGCTDTTACNYDPTATGDCDSVPGGSAGYCCDWTTCAGCMDSTANSSGIGAYSNQTNSLDHCLFPGTNSNASCTIECGDGTDNTDQGHDCCEYTIYGCDGTLNPTALNPTQFPSFCNGNCTIVDDGVTCVYDIYGCMDGGPTGYTEALGFGSVDDGITATNYDPTATVDNGSCQYAAIVGCMDATACNYDPFATTTQWNICVYGFNNITIGDPDLVDAQGNSVNIPAFYDSTTSPVTTIKHRLVNNPSSTPYPSCVLPCSNVYPADALNENDIGLAWQSDNYSQYQVGDSVIMTLYKQDPSGNSWTAVHAKTWTNPSAPSGNQQFGHRYQSSPYPFGNDQFGSNNYQFDIYQANGVTKQMYAIYLHSQRNGLDWGAYGNPNFTSCGEFKTFEFTTLNECDHPASINGCTAPAACNYDYTATCDDGTCYYGTTGGFDCINSGPPLFEDTCVPVSCGTPQFPSLNDCLNGGCGVQ